VKIITLEEHCMNAAILAASQEAIGKSLPRAQKAYGNGLSYTPSIKHAMDLGDLRLAAMDAAGIDMQVLSSNPPGVQLLAADEAVPLAKDANDQLADAVKAHPDRFAAFATLPMSSPEAAAAELERAVNKLGFCGTMINGRTGDLFLDDPPLPRFWKQPPHWMCLFICIPRYHQELCRTHIMVVLMMP
jgi:predicted TIM-barrel fold metal-dependent hydrolase